MIVADALSRIDSVLDAAPVPGVRSSPSHPQGQLRDPASMCIFSYDGKTEVI